VNLIHSPHRQGDHINKTRKNKGKTEEKKMVSAGQPSIIVIIIFKYSNRGRTKGKLLRTTLMVEQKENGFNRPAQLSPSAPLAAAHPSKNSSRGFLIWTKSTHTRNTGQGRKRITILYCV
jgi:hypothetical protein